MKNTVIKALLSLILVLSLAFSLFACDVVAQVKDGISDLIPGFGGKDPDPEEPDPEQPDPEQPDPEQPDPEQPDPEQPDPEQPDPEQPEPEQPDPEQPDPEQPDPEQPDPEQPDPEQPDPEQPDPEQPDPEEPKPEEPECTHEGGDWITTVEPDCDNSGLKVQNCVHCGTEIASDVIPALAHPDSKWITISEPTCILAGEKVLYCTLCSEPLERESIPVSDTHNYVDNKCTWCGDSLASEGLYFISNGDGTCYVAGRGSFEGEHLVIPEVSPEGYTVVAIGSEAFKQFYNVKSLTIPATVTVIRARAFEQCEFLESVILSDGLIEIEERAFGRCTSLTSLHIPASVTAIGSCILEASGKVEEITVAEGSESFKAIDGHLYTMDAKRLVQVANALSEIVIADGVEVIEPYTFYACPNLKSVVIPDSVYSIEKSAFYQMCFEYVDVTIGAGVTQMSGNAFNCANNIVSFTVSADNASFKSIDGVIYSKDGEYIIAYPASKEGSSFDIPDGVVQIKEFAFAYTTKLEQVKLSSSVRAVDTYGFISCSGLKKIIFNEGLTDIRCEAVYSCGDLLEINVPASVTLISQSAFRYCSSLTSATFANPEGWYWSRSENAPGGTRISAEIFADPASAAYALYSSYNAYFLMRTDVPEGGNIHFAYEIEEADNAEREYDSLVKGEGYVWFKIYPTETGYYMPVLTSFDGICSFEIYEDGDKYKTASVGDYFYLYYYTTYYIKCSVSADTSFGISFTKLAGRYKSEPIELKEGVKNPAAYITSMYSTDAYFTFTPTESGSYTFRSDGIENVYFNLNFPENSAYAGVTYYASYGEDGNTSLSVDLTAGETYSLRLYFNKTSKSVPYTIAVSKTEQYGKRADAKVIDLGVTEAEEYDALKLGVVWFKFVCPRDGYYRLRFEGLENKYGFDVFSGYSESILTYLAEYSSPCYNFVEGAVYYIRINNPSASAVGITIDRLVGGSTDDPVVLSLGESDNLKYLREVCTDGDIYLSFTPDKDGYYSIAYTTLDTQRNLYLYDSEMNRIALTPMGNYSVGTKLQGGARYIVRVDHNYNGYNFNYTVTVTELEEGADRLSAIELKVGENDPKAYSAIAEGGTIWFKITPNDQLYGHYILTANGEALTPTSVLNWDYNIQYAETYRGRDGYLLNNSYPYYFCYTVPAGYGELGITVERIETGMDRIQAIDLTLGETQIGNTDYWPSYGKVWYEFTPETDGTYVFTVEDATGVTGYIYGEGNDYLLEEFGDDKGNLTMTYDLQAGVTWYILLRTFREDNRFNIRVDMA